MSKTRDSDETKLQRQRMDKELRARDTLFDILTPIFAAHNTDAEVVEGKIADIIDALLELVEVKNERAAAVLRSQS